MTEFKCINCGEIKDSENICSCPKCGYRMFELPYERREKIIEEIKRFISALEVTEIKRDDLDFEGKGKDDNRFPDYDKILKYVSSLSRRSMKRKKFCRPISPLNFQNLIGKKLRCYIQSVKINSYGFLRMN